MPKDKIGFDIVREIGLRLPGVEAATMHGSPALKLRGALLACIPAHRSAEPDSIVVRVDPCDRAELLAEAPDVYYLPDHYVEYNAILVRLTRVNRGILGDLLRMAHKFLMRKAASPTAARKTRKQKPRA
jgi:hypothetical protein